MSMHPDTRAEVIAALRREIENDPARRGYAGKTAAAICALLDAPVPTETPPAAPRSFAWGEARAIAQSYGQWPAVVVRSRGNPTTPPASAEDLAILTAINAVSMEREQRIDPTDAAAWTAFQAGMQALVGAGDLTPPVAAAILALGTYQPPTPPPEQCRWVAAVIDSISAAPTPTDPIGFQGDENEPVYHPGFAGPPNAADLDLVTEALNA